ncbi:MAG: hypothetical protein EXS03_02590 [Phycisphaerales bacterium]|nr:hypothetical protein [Phycisphaerales bacterium]
MTGARDGDSLVTVHLASTEFEAQTIVAVLVEREIDAVAFPSAMQTLGLEGIGAQSLGGVPVQVRERDLERAKSALRANKFLADSVDWDQVDVGEEDPDAVRLGKRGGFLTFGSTMVAVGKAAVAVIVILQVVWLVARCG